MTNPNVTIRNINESCKIHHYDDRDYPAAEIVLRFNESEMSQMQENLTSFYPQQFTAAFYFDK